MGNYEQLIAAIEQVIKTNGNNEITGAILQSTLKSIVNSVGSNATFAGIAFPYTNPGTPDQNVFYIAGANGMYVNFDNIDVGGNVISILANNNGTWKRYITQIPNQTFMDGRSKSAIYGNYTLDNDTFVTTDKCNIVGLLQNDGTILTGLTDYRTTDFVKIPDGSLSIVWYGVFPQSGPYSGLCLYDSSKNFVASVSGSFYTTDAGNTGELELSQYPTAKYIRASFYSSAISLFVGFGIDASPKKKLENLTFHTSTKNLLDVTKIQDGKYIAGDHISSADGYWITNPIIVTPGKYIVISANNKILLFYSYIFYDASDNVISSAAFTGRNLPYGRIQVPENAAKFVAGFVKADVFISDDLQINALPEQVMIEQNDDGSVSDFDAPNNVIASYDYIARESLPLAKKMKIVPDFNIYGYIADGGVAFQQSDYGALLTIKNSQFEKDGYLDVIGLGGVNWVEGATIRFCVGLLDQRNMLVNGRYFDCVTTRSGDFIHKFNVRERNIAVAAGEQLFVQICYDRVVASWVLAESNVGIDNEMLYGSANGIIGRLSTTYGGRVTLIATVHSYESSPFAMQGTVENLNNSIAAIESDINNIRYVYDANNVPYKLKVDSSGNVIALPVNYRKVLALGNSLTEHGLAENIGYHGNGWAMAATSKPLDWCSHLQTILRQKAPAAVVTRKNIFDWETNYLAVDLSALLDTELADNPDLIIFRAGENGSTPSQEEYYTGVMRLINYIKASCPDAEIVMTSLFWSNTVKDAAIQQAANALSLRYINTGSVGSQAEKLGDFTFGEDNNQYPIINSGVQAHMCDLGFYQFANILATQFGYESLDLAHNIDVNASVDYYVNKTVGISGSLISVQTFGGSAPTIVVKDSDNSTISGTLHNMSSVVWQTTPNPIPTYVYTFIMPNKDVTITIN